MFGETSMSINMQACTNVVCISLFFFFRGVCRYLIYVSHRTSTSMPECPVCFSIWYSLQETEKTHKGDKLSEGNINANLSAKRVFAASAAIHCSVYVFFGGVIGWTHCFYFFQTSAGKAAMENLQGKVVILDPGPLDATDYGQLLPFVIWFAKHFWLMFAISVSRP